MFPQNEEVSTDEDIVAVTERYRRFARSEAPGRSDLYEAWARKVADSHELAAIVARLPPTKRQPPLVFAIARLAGTPETPDALAAWLPAHAEEFVAEASRRSLQSNEPLRCAALLPALSLVDGPIALLEIGVSAGLCLYPDRYSYRYVRDGGDAVALDPVGGPSSVVLESRLRGSAVPFLRLPDVVWRAGIDLHPLDPRDPETERWLSALVWPGETGRVARIAGALEIARADPPRLFAGDALDSLAEAAASAPAEATLVVTTPGVIIHIPGRRREELITQIRALGRWVTIDQLATHRGWTSVPDPERNAFAVALDGQVLGYADPLGAWLEWRPDARLPAA